jgi:hypothetical protein
MRVEGKRLGAGDSDAETAVPDVTRYVTNVSGTRSTGNCATIM